MNREDILRMAREAGFETASEWENHPNGFVRVVVRFAALVAAAEREACAKVAALTICDTHIPTGIKIYGTAAAKAIQARGQA